MSLAHGNQTLTDLSIHPWSQHADDQINPEIAGVTYLATGCCPIRRSNWTLFNLSWSTEIDSTGMEHRYAWRGNSNWLLSNPEIEPTRMQAILTLVVELVVERTYA